MVHPGRLVVVLALAGCGGASGGTDGGSDETGAGVSTSAAPTSGDATSVGSTSTAPTSGGEAGTTTGEADTGTTTDTGGAGEWMFEVIDEQVFPLNGMMVRVEFVRAIRPDGGRSYLLYQRAPGPAAPLVIQTEPYAGIDWTGEAVDAKWAALGDGGHPDEDAPDYDGVDMVAYALQDPAEAIGANNVWAFNGFAAIHAYGRFYAGGSLEDDVLDAVAPYAFARTRPDEIDLERIGAFGSSWGGMMALFGASQAPPEAAPRTVVPISAPSDFVELWTWGTDTLPSQSANPGMVTGFYSPYWRRVTPTAGDPPGGAPALAYTHAGLCPGLPGTVVMPHDEWDAIIPVAQTQGMATSCANVEPVYWPRAEPLDLQATPMTHGPFVTESPLPAVFVYTYGNLVVALAPEEAQVVYSVTSAPSLTTHLQRVLAAQAAGADVAWILPRLRQLADPRLQVFVAETNQLAASADVLAGVVNAVWGTDLDADGLRTQLEAGLPDPP